MTSDLHTDLFTYNGSVADAYRNFLRDQKRYFRMSGISFSIGLGALIVAIVSSPSYPFLFVVSALGFWFSLIAKQDESNCNYMMHMIDYHHFMRSHPSGE